MPFDFQTSINSFRNIYTKSGIFSDYIQVLIDHINKLELSSRTIN